MKGQLVKPELAVSCGRVWRRVERVPRGEVRNIRRSPRFILLLKWIGLITCSRYLHRLASELFGCYGWLWNWSKNCLFVDIRISPDVGAVHVKLNGGKTHDRDDHVVLLADDLAVLLGRHPGPVARQLHHRLGVHQAVSVTVGHLPPHTVCLPVRCLLTGQKSDNR